MGSTARAGANLPLPFPDYSGRGETGHGMAWRGEVRRGGAGRGRARQGKEIKCQKKEWLSSLTFIADMSSG